jgi:hypothetical protein
MRYDDFNGLKRCLRSRVVTAGKAQREGSNSARATPAASGDAATCRQKSRTAPLPQMATTTLPLQGQGSLPAPVATAAARADQNNCHEGSERHHCRQWRQVLPPGSGGCRQGQERLQCKGDNATPVAGWNRALPLVCCCCVCSLCLTG